MNSVAKIVLNNEKSKPFNLKLMRIFSNIKCFSCGKNQGELNIYHCECDIGITHTFCKKVETCCDPGFPCEKWSCIVHPKIIGHVKTGTLNYRNCVLLMIIFFKTIERNKKVWDIIEDVTDWD